MGIVPMHLRKMPLKYWGMVSSLNGPLWLPSVGHHGPGGYLRLVLILAGSLFYGTVSFQKKLVSNFFVPLSTNYLSYQSSVH